MVDRNQQANCLVVVGIELGSLFIECRGLCEVTALKRSARVEVIGFVKFGIETDSCFEFLLRLREILFQRESQATSSVSFVSRNAFELQLVFMTGQPLATNGLNFALQVSTGINGHIEVSTDLVDWLTLTNFIGTNPTINLRDPAAINFNQRFYRAVTP